MIVFCFICKLLTGPTVFWQERAIKVKVFFIINSSYVLDIQGIQMRFLDIPPARETKIIQILHSNK